MPLIGPGSNKQISDDAVARMKQDMLPLSEAAAKVTQFSERMDSVEVDVQAAKDGVDRIAPADSPPGPGASIAEGIMGPVWRDGPVNADWYSDIRQSFDAAGVGGRIQFSKGVVYITANPIEVQSGQEVIGNDVLIQATGDAAIRSRNTTNKVERVQIDGLRIYGNNNLGIGFDFTGMVDSHVTNFHLINWVDYGAKFGGTEDSGGWSNTLSHGRIWASPASGKSDSACVWIGGVNSGGIPNGNKILALDLRMQSNTAHAVLIDRGDGNLIIGCDMGYAASASAPPAVLLRGGLGTRGNSFVANRYEKAAGNLVIEDAYNNHFVDEYYGTTVGGYTGFNVRILGGNGNFVHPTEAGLGAANDWVQINADGNIVIYRGRYYTRNANYPVFATRRPGEATDRFSINEAGQMRWGAGGAQDVQLDRSGANTLRLAYGDSFLIEGGGWNTGLLQLGVYHLWVDSSGRLRVKNGAPTSTNDGTIVGSQT